MNNEERRVALAEARQKAMHYASAADEYLIFDSSGVVKESRLRRREHIMTQARTWAEVANAMKVGPGLEADGVLDHHVMPGRAIR